MRIDEIKVASPFKDLFEIQPANLQAIEDHMARFGFDPSQPIVLWKEKRVVLDGHTRLRAAENLRNKGRLFRAEVPVVERSFRTQDEALLYAIHNQTERRNLTNWDVLQLVKKVDALLPRGGDRRSEGAREKSNFGKPKLDSRERTAEIVRISLDKVSQCRFVLNRCDQKTLDLIRYGEKTLNQIYRKAERNSPENLSQISDKKNDETQELLKGFNPLDFYKGRQRRGHAIKGRNRLNKKTSKMVNDLFTKHIPALKRIKVMTRIKLTVEQLINLGWDEALLRQPGFKKFLGSQLVSDVLFILETFGFEIKRPKDLPMEPASKLIQKEGRKREFRGFPWDRPGYMPRIQRDNIDERVKNAVRRDIEEGRLKI